MSLINSISECNVFFNLMYNLNFKIMKRVFNGYSKTMTIEMDYEDYINLMCAIDYEASRENYTAYKEEFKLLLKEIEESEYISIWPEDK